MPAWVLVGTKTATDDNVASEVIGKIPGDADAVLAQVVSDLLSGTTNIDIRFTQPGADDDQGIWFSGFNVEQVLPDFSIDIKTSQERGMRAVDFGAPVAGVVENVTWTTTNLAAGEFATITIFARVP